MKVDLACPNTIFSKCRKFAIFLDPGLYAEARQFHLLQV